MQRLTFSILTIILCLMGITPFVPGTEAFEILIMPLFGNNVDVCSVWMEDSNHNLITYIPQGLNHHDDYIKFYCGGHMPQYGDSGVIPKNDVITLQTLDSTTTYRIYFRIQQGTPYFYYIDKYYTSDACLVFMGYDYNSWDVKELGYNECKFLRDGRPNQSADKSVLTSAVNTVAVKSVGKK
ncbi:11214_t:CDS:2 [Funneliformis caledonium]|uniref:11214_t:CDS:1 n=1 Tax=Funneliformis caledonium TaxID=1117310 RepID=A0A9N9ALZ8_9GLOM|nr:11214_t:CDS:2 [Funneliformis caledonium]